MEFKIQIALNGKFYTHVDTQRGNVSAVYKDETTYLRIGKPEKIVKDLILHKKMESLGFPIPKLLEEGEMEDMFYFVEESLGDKCFGEIFTEETKNLGAIQDETFDQFTSSCMTLAEVQITTATSEQNWEEFEKGIHLDLICEELPELKEKIVAKVEQIKMNLAGFPFALSHGDFTPFNVYKNGIIDFEDAFSAPCVYDAGSMNEILNWFPKSSEYEFYQLWSVSKEQEQKYLLALDALYVSHGLAKPSEFLEDLNFVKGVWFTVNMAKTPKLQQFRYDYIKTLV